MKHVFRLWTLVAIGVVLSVNMTAQAGTATGSIRRLIPDSHRKPLAGAAVPAMVEAAPFFGANFAISEQIGKDANVVINGQAGIGTGAPQKLQALTTAHVGDHHRFAVALGYGRFTFSRHAAQPHLGQFSVSATDT